MRARVLLLACIVGAGLASDQPSYALAGQPLSAPPGPTPTKPGLGGPTAPTPDSAENTQEAWQRRVIARLYSLSHMLPRMPANGASVSADVLFNIDRKGHILYYKIARTSGNPTLDRAIRTLIAHADPLPPPPLLQNDLPGSPVWFEITIGYYNKPN